MSEASIKELIHYQIKALGKEVDDIKQTANDAKNLAAERHYCLKGEVLESLISSVNELRGGQMKIVEELGHWRFFKRLFFVMVTLVIGAVATAAVSFSNTNYDVKLQNNVMSRDIDTLAQGQEKMAKDIEDIKSMKKELKIDPNDQFRLMKRAFTEAMGESKTHKKRAR